MEYEYIGQELELFKEAINWKGYSFGQFSSFIKGDVLEVGAGIGTNTLFFSSLANVKYDSWTATEIDMQQVEILRGLKAEEPLAGKLTIKQAYVSDLDRQYDTLIYIDVLEHIEDDRGEMLNALKALKPNGHLIVLCPAHNWLFSPFDKSIGHYRRYDKKKYLEILPPEFKILRLRYLDSIGILASATNKMFLKKSYPTLKEVKFWDNYIVPISKITDGLLFYALGKSILMVVKKQ